uniref:Uncharacterized protein n=1 Tax=Ditylenchus dipsaci TaxID=166011 RepID=A0A915DTI0_9BILA
MCRKLVTLNTSNLRTEMSCDVATEIIQDTYCSVINSSVTHLDLTFTFRRECTIAQRCYSSLWRRTLLFLSRSCPNAINFRVDFSFVDLAKPQGLLTADDLRQQMKEFVVGLMYAIDWMTQNVLQSQIMSASGSAALAVKEDAVDYVSQLVEQHNYSVLHRKYLIPCMGRLDTILSLDASAQLFLQTGSSKAVRQEVSCK